MYDSHPSTYVLTKGSFLRPHCQQADRQRGALTSSWPRAPVRAQWVEDLTPSVAQACMGQDAPWPSALPSGFTLGSLSRPGMKRWQRAASHSCSGPTPSATHQPEAPGGWMFSPHPAPLLGSFLLFAFLCRFQGDDKRENSLSIC